MDQNGYTIEERLRERLTALIRSGEKVVIDFSFWNRANRDRYRALIREAGGTPRLVYMKAEKAVLRERLAIRNQSLHANSAYVITDEILDRYFDGFEEPTEEDVIIIEQK